MRNMMMKMKPGTNPLERALGLPNGARFYKCALQVNPHHYAETYRGEPAQGDEENYARKLVEKAVELNISVLAITDHNHVAGIASIKAAANNCGIHVFPGFEISSSEGIHVLCIYPLDTDEAQLERYLGEFGIRNTDPSSHLSNKPFTEILRCVRDQGGVTIAAHATNNGGLFRVLSGQARVCAWKDENLVAIQIPGAVQDLPHEYRLIVENKNPKYRRTRPVAVVNARDVVRPEDLEGPSAICWIKMSGVSIEGLRQAFLDPGSRIRLSSDPVPEGHTEFVAIAWEGGFLDGAAIHFNENLNVLIGGRGTGKSTIIESLRYVLALEPLGEDARKAHEGIVRNVLKSGTKISLLVRSHRPNEQEYRVERTIPNPPVVKNKNGDVLNLTPSDVVTGVEIFGQHELAELAKSPEKRTRLLRRFVKLDPAVAQRKAEVRRKLERSRAKIVELSKELGHVGERLAELPRLEETLKRFQEAGLEERLKEQSLLVREEKVLETAYGRLEPYRELLTSLRADLPVDRTFVSPKALEGLPGAQVLSEIEAVLDELSRELEGIARKMEGALNSAETGLDSIKAKWEVRKREVQAEYEKILRELQKSKVDGEEFIQLRRQIEALRPLRERHDLLQRAREEQEAHRRSLLAEWEDLKAEEFRQLERAAENVSGRLAGRVRVQLTYAGNREPLLQLLRERVGGRLSETLEALRNLDDLSLKDFADTCRAGKETLVEKYKLPSTQAERLVQAPPEVIMQIEELDLPPTTEIELNVAAEGQPAQWQRIEDLSTGQKATAMLLLMLLESDAPLVVDQPEDDLDNRFITEGVVPKMREEKRRRQFVFSTHNANIPVLGDAELIVGLAASGEGAEEGRARIQREHMGSIDAQPVRELVEEVLEGGREAFEMRRLKYGF